jgi:hypothetical protein
MVIILIKRALLRASSTLTARCIAPRNNQASLPYDVGPWPRAHVRQPNASH